MPWTAAFCVVGAASISAFPLFSGFVSKSMIMAAMVEQGHTLGWIGLLFASAGVFHHAGIKIPFFAFFAHDARLRVAEAPGNMLVAMAIAAAGCIAIGSYPAALYGLLPWEAGYVPYSYPHVIVQLQLLLFSALAFAWLKLTGIYPPELRSVNLDADWLYRRLATRAATGAIAVLAAARQRALRAAERWADRMRRWPFVPRDAMTLHSQTSGAALLVGASLAIYLLLYFVST
jgi:multicomponent Na+:H+ antiporter subunit D